MNNKHVGNRDRSNKKAVIAFLNYNSTRSMGYEFTEPRNLIT